MHRQQWLAWLQPGAVFDTVGHLIATGAEHLVEYQQRDVNACDQPGARGTIDAVATAPAGTVASVVISGP